jgi:monoamine oxidase
MKNLRTAFAAEKLGISESELNAKLDQPQNDSSNTGITRRELIITGAAAGGAILGSVVSTNRLFAAPPTSLDVGIVGAGLAGLVCATELKKIGFIAKLYEASDRTGGRCWSLANLSPGQNCERGGELIDNLHKTMISYAKEFGLTLEDVGKVTGEVFYYFNGQKYSEADIVREYRAFVATMHADLRRLSAGPSAAKHNDFDVQMDRVSLAEYLAGNNGMQQPCPPIARAAISEAYKAEYGLDPSEQSCLNLLMFIHADKRSRFQPWGVFSDERYHIVEGNDQIAKGLEAKITGQVDFGMSLKKVAKTAAGRIELTFTKGSSTVTRTHDHVVLAIPFSVLRLVTLDASLGLSASKKNIIDNFGYGTNAKTMIAFKSRPWLGAGCNGASYSNLPNHQATWETSPTTGTAARGIITDYGSARRGASMLRSNAQADAVRWAADFEKLVPGIKSSIATNSDGTLRTHVEPWPTNPLSLGSYSCYRPGQFTTMLGLEGAAAGNLHFSGEHTNSYYEWQGFMEGGCLSGIAAFQELVKK